MQKSSQNEKMNMKLSNDNITKYLKVGNIVYYNSNKK